MLSASRFNAHLSNRNGGVGQAIAWRRASLCPCRNPTSGAPRQGCPVCNAKGVLWEPPVSAWAGMSGMKSTREWAAFGLWESGDVVLTVPSDSPLYAAGESDRCMMTDSTEPFSSILTHGAADKLLWPVLSIDAVFWLSDDGETMVTGGIPAQAADLTLSWPAGQTAPPAGTQYSIKGRRHPEYYLFQNFPTDRAHYGGQPLPRRVILRKLDLFGR